MEFWTTVRRQVLTGELSQRAACEKYHLGWHTLKKILAHDEPPGYRQSQPRKKRKFERFVPIVHEILAADREVPKKQRHTAWRIFERLRDEHGYDGSYTTVKDAVRAWNQSHREVFLPLLHPPGEILGLNWFIPNLNGKRSVRHVLFDTNYWKSFIQARLKVALGDGGCLSLYGDKPEQHRLLAEHLTAEYRIRTEGRGRTVDEWKIRPERSDNHWLDCLVGCAVGASLLGVHLPETGSALPPKRRTVDFSQLQRQRNDVRRNWPKVS